MKTAKDPRHLQRIKVMQDVFAWEFRQEDSSLETKTSKSIIASLDQIDKMIEEAAPAWPIDKINKIDLATLRLAIFELAILPKADKFDGEIPKDAPTKVVVDEAVEIGKEYGSDSSASFINGVLGKVISLQNIPLS